MILHLRTEAFAIRGFKVSHIVCRQAKYSCTWMEPRNWELLKWCRCTMAGHKKRTASSWTGASTSGFVPSSSQKCQSLTQYPDFLCERSKPYPFKGSDRSKKESFTNIWEKREPHELYTHTFMFPVKHIIHENSIYDLSMWSWINNSSLNSQKPLQLLPASVPAGFLSTNIGSVDSCGVIRMLSPPSPPTTIVCHDNPADESWVFSRQAYTADSVHLFQVCNSFLSGNESKELEKRFRKRDQLARLSDHLADNIPLSRNIFSRHYQHDFSIYSPDLIFDNEYFWLQNRQLKLHSRGIFFYKLQLATMSTLVKLKCANVERQVLTQEISEHDNSLKIRWRSVGKSRLAYTFWFTDGFAKHMHTSDSFSRYFECYSVLYLDESGLVARHVLSKVRTDRKTDRVFKAVGKFATSAVGRVAYHIIEKCRLLSSTDLCGARTKAS